MDFVHQKYDQPGLSEEEQVRFFEQALECAQRAEDQAGMHSEFIELAGVPIELRFAGEPLIEKTVPALAHLRIPAVAEPAFRIHLWDSQSTGVAMVDPPVAVENFTNRGDIWGMSSPRLRCAYQWMDYSVNLLDLQTGAGVFWVNSAATVPNWTRSSPLRSMLHWCMEARGRQLVHGAAIGTEDGAVFITGRGGIGKSTTALACLDQGMQLLGDDYIVVQLEPEPTLHSLYCVAKLSKRQLLEFPRLGALVGPDDYLEDGKGIVSLYPAFEAQLARSLPLRAMLTPEFAGSEGTSFAAATPMQLLQAAAIPTMSQLPHAGPVTYDFMRRMVESAPVGRIRLGSAIDRIPDKLASAIVEGMDRVLEVPAGPPRGGERPLVSVVIPAHNGAEFLSAAIASITAQQYPAIEIIVVDDGSTDATPDVVRAYGDQVRYIYQDNAGPAAARNRGIRDVSGKFIAFLDADDLWVDGSLERLIQHMMDEPDLDVVHGHAQVFQHDDGGGRVNYVNPDEVFPHYIGAGLYRQRAFEMAGLFDERLQFSEDSEWYGRAADLGVRIGRLEDLTLRVRRHGNNMTRNKSMKDLEVLRVFKFTLDRVRAAQAEHAAQEAQAIRAAS